MSDSGQFIAETYVELLITSPDLGIYPDQAAPAGAYNDGSIDAVPREAVIQEY